jgi:hypothetical protein
MQHRLQPDTADSLADAAQVAGDRFEWIGRAGWVAKGVVYALVGVLFLQIAIGSGRTDEANQAGALEAISNRPFGRTMLIITGIGLALYTVWRLFTVVLPGDWRGRALLDRLGYLVSVVVYGALLVTIVGIVRRSDMTADGNEDRMVEGIVKDLLSMQAGRTLVILAGLSTVVVGLVFARKGWTRGFRDQIAGDDGVEGTMIDRLGTVGWIARGVSVVLIGFFLIRAAWMFDPNEAAGLDDSVRQIASNPAGALLSALVGVGFIAFGAFAALSARHRILKGPRNDT